MTIAYLNCNVVAVGPQQSQPSHWLLYVGVSYSVSNIIDIYAVGEALCQMYDVICESKLSFINRVEPNIENFSKISANMLKNHFTASVTILFFNQRRTGAVKYLTRILPVFLLIPRSN